MNEMIRIGIDTALKAVEQGAYDQAKVGFSKAKDFMKAKRRV